MNEEQRIVFLQAQILAATLKMQGMTAANIQASLSRSRFEPVTLPFQQKEHD